MQLWTRVIIVYKSLCIYWDYSNRGAQNDPERVARHHDSRGSVCTECVFVEQEHIKCDRSTAAAGSSQMFSVCVASISVFCSTSLKLNVHENSGRRPIKKRILRLKQQQAELDRFNRFWSRTMLFVQQRAATTNQVLLQLRRPDNLSAWGDSSYEQQQQQQTSHTFQHYLYSTKHPY